MTNEIIIIFVLLLFNAFFALSEMAIVSCSKPMLRQKAESGNRRAKAALKLAEESGRFLSTVQVGITLVGTLAGAYGGANIADKLAPMLNEYALISPHGELVAVVLVVAIITYLSVVIGELIPKQLALSKSEALAMWTAIPMTYISWICTPVVLTLERSANLFFLVFGIGREQEKVSEAEVKAILAEGAASGAIDEKEHVMLQRIIRLGDRDITSVMTHRVNVVYLDIEDDLTTIRRKVHEAGHSRYPVTSGDITNVIGIVQAKELLDEALTNPGELHIRNHIKQVPMLTESTSCLDALEVFKTSSVHMAVVMDEYGGAVGVVTPADLLEAIVGIMPSNYANDDPLIVQRDDGSWLVDGITPIDEIHLVIGLDEIDAGADYDTIAGFILSRMGRKPEVGESFEAYGYTIEVIDLDGPRIDKVMITPIIERGETE